MRISARVDQVGLKAVGLVLSVVCWLSWPLPAHATERLEGDQGALATIEVSTSREVLQDQVRVVFSAQAAGSSAADVNRKLSDALSQARANFTVPEGIEVSTGGFNVYVDYGKDNKPRGWTGRASLVIDSQNLESVSAVIEHFGKSLAVSSVQFSLSRKARRAQEKALMQDLASEFGERANLATQAFGFKQFEIIALDFTEGAGFAPRSVTQRIAAAPMMVQAGPSVSLEPSMTTVEISVVGQIRLRH